MIGIVDYGAGNLRSVGNALAAIGQPYALCADGSQIDKMERLILPGVGHFGSAVRALRERGLLESLRAWTSNDRPLLGICLGMQLLLEGSDEAEDEAGLGVIPGRAKLAPLKRVPHMGWNFVEWGSLSGYYYFAHSYVASVDAPYLIADAEQDQTAVAAVIERGRARGVQFHPEKSGPLGQQLLREFCQC